MREIDWRIKAIGERQNRAYEFTAAIHGVPLKNKSKKELTKLSDNQEQKLNDAVNHRLAKGRK